MSIFFLFVSYSYLTSLMQRCNLYEVEMGGVTKTDSGSAPVPKTWTPVCGQILESESAPDPDLNLCPSLNITFL